MDQNPPKESRPPINLRIKFRSESVEQFIERYAVDVSRGGIFIRTREPLAVGTQLKLDFQFQNGTPLMAGDGTVVWIREFDANRTTVPPGMGVRFDKLTPESQAVLEQLLVEKAKRERSGIPGSGSQGAGGIAVRRPSSTFSVLESQGAGSGPQATGSSPVGGAGSGPVRPDSSLSPLAAVTSQVATSALQGAASASAPVAGVGDSTQKTDAPAYQALGKARNPFSSAGDQRSSESPRSPATSASASENDDDDSAAPFDDINDEPTQIAGRLPSFLLSDDDATVANVQLPVKSTEANADEKAGDRRKDAAALPRSPLPGMGRTDQPDARQGKDAPKDKDRKGAFPAKDVKDEPAEATRRPSAQHAKIDGTAKATAAVLTGGAADTATVATATSKAAEAEGAKPGATKTANKTADKTAAKATPTKSSSQARRSGAALVAATVIVLGGGGIFLYRFFASQSTQTGPSLASGGPTTAGPAPGAVPAEAPAAAGSASPETPPSGTAQLGGNTSSASNPAMAAGPTPDSPAPNTVGAAAGAPREPAGPDEGAAAASANDGSNRKSITKHKPRGGRENAGPGGAAEQASKVGQPGTPAAALPAAAVSTAAAPPKTATAPVKAEQQSAPAAEADGPSHQIRVSSKPDGADVTLDGQTVGKTPFTVGIADIKAPHFIALRKEGFEPFEQMISATSGWSKAKSSPQGKTALQVLKINAKLKAIGGAEVRPPTEPGPVGTVGTVDSAGRAAAPKTPAAPAKAAPGPDSPLPPADERPAATDNKP
ncbi:MAG: TIGR02266 family protein [Myxococcales bacterium]